MVDPRAPLEAELRRRLKCIVGANPPIDSHPAIVQARRDLDDILAILKLGNPRALTLIDVKLKRVESTLAMVEKRPFR